MTQDRTTGREDPGEGRDPIAHEPPSGRPLPCPYPGAPPTNPLIFVAGRRSPPSGDQVVRRHRPYSRSVTTQPRTTHHGGHDEQPRHWRRRLAGRGRWGTDRARTSTAHRRDGCDRGGQDHRGPAPGPRAGVPFLDADDFHSPTAIASMRAGHPLGDEQRLPWLRRVNAALRRQPDGVASACSALERSYRDVLRDGVDGLRFVFLDVDANVLAERLRSARRSLRRRRPPPEPARHAGARGRRAAGAACRRPRHRRWSRPRCCTRSGSLHRRRPRE